MIPLKWLIGIGVLTVLIFALVLTGRKSVQIEVFIPAEVGQVWSVLTDLQKYSEWNSVLRLKEEQSRISLKQGEKITYTFSQDNENVYDIASTIRLVEENIVLNQGGGMPMVLTFDHFYRLEGTKDGVIVTIYEEYRGIGVHFWNPEPVELAYQRLGRELHDRVLEVEP